MARIEERSTKSEDPILLGTVISSKSMLFREASSLFNQNRNRETSNSIRLIKQFDDVFYFHLQAALCDPGAQL